MEHEPFGTAPLCPGYDAVCGQGDHTLAGYRFDLPEEQIAQYPVADRGASRLFVVRKDGFGSAQAMFSDLAAYLPRNALLVANNSRVLPARILGTRPTGGKVEFLLLTPLPLINPLPGTGGGSCEYSAHAEGLLRTSARVRQGQMFHFEELVVEVVRTGTYGKCDVILHWSGDLASVFMARGHLPLPPYIRRKDTQEDRARYQTIYSRPDRLGSVAAPTAGLHFTHALREDLASQGFGWAEVTLYVGYGTFSPVRCENIREHTMHKEYIEITQETVLAISQAKEAGRPVVAVGTTATRVLEGAWAQQGCIGPYAGWTNIFIHPGYRFQVVDHMITNFHLPESSLLMMVAAFTGRKKILAAYKEAIAAGYRFFSYGDAMLVL